ncbi:MAG TPA: LuxR C-terminal-related transcriptional regulator [Actinomycetota bacterium]
MATVRVGVVDEHEIFRRGVVACLAEEGLRVVLDAPRGPVTEPLDVAVVSAEALASERFNCPLVLCTADGRTGQDAAGNEVLGVLPRSTLTVEQLVATVRAAAAGLRVSGIPSEGRQGSRIEGRELEVLRLLAQGAGTREIAQSLSYSERTVKTLIQEIGRELGARSRAQAVAEGIRLGII